MANGACWGLSSTLHSDAEKGRYYVTRHIKEIVTQSRGRPVEIPKFKAQSDP